jgi:hypothetical protein
MSERNKGSSSLQALLDGTTLMTRNGPRYLGLNFEGYGKLKFSVESHKRWSGANVCGMRRRFRASAWLS